MAWWRAQLELGKAPADLRYIHELMIVGMVVRYEDYLTIPAQVWGDIILWKEAEAERARHEREKERQA